MQYYEIGLKSCLLSLTTTLVKLEQLSKLDRSFQFFHFFCFQNNFLLFSFWSLRYFCIALRIQEQLGKRQQFKMKSQSQWRIKYVQTSSECGSDNEQSQLKHQLHCQEAATRQATMLAQHYKSLNQNFQKVIDKLTMDCSQLAKCDGHCLQSSAQNSVQQLQAQLETEVSKFTNLLKTFHDTEKLLAKARFEGKSKDSEIQQLRDELACAGQISRQQINGLRSQLSALSASNQQLTTSLAQSRQQSQQERRKHLQNYQQLIRQRKSLKKQLEQLTKENFQLHNRNKQIRRDNGHSDKQLTWCAINQKLLAEITKMQEKMGSKDKELTIVKKELAEMQVKLDRYETALKNSDRKIAELQGMLSDTKICLMSRAVTEGSEDTKTKSSSLRNVTQKLKRVFEGAQELKDCSSRATTQTATNQASSSLMEMSLGSFPKRYRKISNLSNVPLYQSNALQQNDPSLMNSNIRLLQSVQLKHSQTDANLLASIRSLAKPMNRSGQAATTDRNYNTDRDHRLTKKPPNTVSKPTDSRDTLIKQQRTNYMR